VASLVDLEVQAQVVLMEELQMAAQLENQLEALLVVE
jgi:hypothetical protein